MTYKRHISIILLCGLLALTLACEEGERTVVYGTRCKVYRQCNNNELYLYACPRGKSFDINSTTCKRRTQCLEGLPICSLDIFNHQIGNCVGLVECYQEKENLTVIFFHVNDRQPIAGCSTKVPCLHFGEPKRRPVSYVSDLVFNEDNNESKKQSSNLIFMFLNMYNYMNVPTNTSVAAVPTTSTTIFNETQTLSSKVLSRPAVSPFGSSISNATVNKDLSQTLTPSGSLVCKEGEKKPNHDDCTKYLECKNNTYVEKQCTLLRIFDIRKNECNLFGDCIKDETTTSFAEYASSLETLRLSGTFVCEEGETRPNFDDCLKYSECNNNTFVEKKCDPPQKFDVNIQLCIVEGDCATTEQTTPVNENTSSIRTDTLLVCKEGETRPDYIFCTNYFECQDNEFVEKRCEFPLMFDVKTNMCRYAAVCASEENRPFSSTEHTVPQYVSFICEEGDRKHDYEDCNKYFECQENRFVEQTCEYPLMFDVKTKMCRYAAVCAVRKGQTTSSTEHTVSQNVTLVCKEGDKKPNYADCIRYLQCQDNRYVEKICEYPLMFDVKTNMCRYAAFCALRNDNRNSSSEYMVTPSIPLICKEGDTIPNYDDCTKYFQCQENSFVEKTCASPLRFDVNKKYCRYTAICAFTAEKTTTSSTERTITQNVPLVCKEGDKKPTYDCTRYLLCRNNHFVEQKCEIPLKFDVKRNSCMYGAVCATKGNTTTSSTEQRVTPKVPFVCREGEIKPNNDDCNKYYLCHQNEFHEKKCDNRRQFDDKKRGCYFSDCVTDSETTTSISDQFVVD